MDRHTRTALELARSAFGEVRLAEASILRDGRHRWVQRLKLVTGSGVRSVIAKTCQARERIALELLTEVAAWDVPRLLAVCDDPLVVLLDDVGSGSSVADHLLGGHPEGAARAVELWATTLARVHAGGLALGSEFQRRLETDASRARTTGTGDRYR